MYRLPFIIASFVASSLSLPVRAQGLDVTARDFELYMAWKDGREDPRLEKATDKVRKQKIAKSVGASVKELDAAVIKVEPVAAGLANANEKSIKEALERTPLKGRILEVEVSTGQPLVVAGVKWQCGDARDHDKEAAYVAYATGQGSKLVRTLALWCIDDSKRKLFSGTIDRTGFEKISDRAIERFASSRYINLFVGVKRGPHE